MKSTTTRGTPYTHIGPSGSNSGYRQSGGNADNTVGEQYRGSGINTQTNARGTPAQYEHGNPGDASRVASHDKYGMVESNEQGNANNPANNGSGVILDGAHYANGFSPHAETTLDSPIPRDAPRFDTGFIATEDAAHLGKGSHAERSREGLVAGGGVMSRGMLGTSTPGMPETALTDDDTLPAVGPAGKA